MHYLLESVVVGVYTSFMYGAIAIIRKPSVADWPLVLMAVGFCKHFFGSYLHLHTMYCNHGNACVFTLSPEYQYRSNAEHLLRDSVLEAFLFVAVGLTLSGIVKNPYILFFVVGTLLHIGAELIGVHKHFCETSCITYIPQYTPLSIRPNIP